MFTFEDEEEHITVADSQNWEDITEDDLAMMHWLVIEMDNELSEDAKLSTQKRKSLPSSSFCGPNRSFPVPDCAHVTAARRLIGRFKGPGNKSKILACVARKAKALGCPGSSNNDQIGGEMTVAEMLQNKEVKDHISSEISKTKDQYEAQLSAITALDEKVKAQAKDIDSKVKEIKSLTDNVSGLEKIVQDLKTSIHKNFVDRVFDLRKSLQKKDVMDLKDDKEIEEYKSELAKRTDESLNDAISDLEKEEPVSGPSKKISSSVSDDKLDENQDIVDISLSGSDSKNTSTGLDKSRAEVVKSRIFGTDK